ncbi:MAG: dTDP-4-dehydrorhamnose 3,5-epimerase [Candidatus Heimdallarchaeota archaeon]|nr:dTDP-4-dehydrorhamnose 3,5-epimerase [Candidatus Heimdallarchaeota archaeon]
MPFEFQRLEIPDVILVKPKLFKDDRGSFMESYKKSDFLMNGIDVNFVQDNESISDIGVIRGLHYQIKPKDQGKLVRVIKGKILDVAVDIRNESPTFGKYVARELTESNKYMLWIPSGFAHGFLSLEDNTIVNYKVSNEYSKEHEASIIWNDNQLNIDWGLKNPKISEKDLLSPSLKNAIINF